jgi:hypothetical protein
VLKISKKVSKNKYIIEEVFEEAEEAVEIKEEDILENFKDLTYSQSR